MFLLLMLVIILDFLYFKLRYSSPKGPPVWYMFPFVGISALMFLPKSIYVPMYNWYLRDAPDIIIVRMPGPTILVKGAAAKAMYANENCQSKPQVRAMSYLGLLMTGKYGMVYTDGGVYDWKPHRKIDLTALYALPKREMIFRSSEVVDVFLQEIEKHEETVWDCEHELAVSKYQESANLNLGATFEDDDIRQFVGCVAAMFRSILLISTMLAVASVDMMYWIEGFFPRVVRPSLFVRVYTKALWKLIQSRISDKKEGTARDFMQATLRVKEPEEAHKYLCAALLFLMGANTHSTHHTILTTLTYLAVRPHCQKKLYEEVQTVLGQEKLTLDHLDQMHYLRALIMEANRLDSPFPFNLRYCTAPTTIYGREVPGNMPICVAIHAENYDPVYFPDPYSFQPERFLDENGRYYRDTNLGVFGGGKRECPGKHINAITASVYVSKIMQHYEVVPVDANVDPPEYNGAMFPSPAKVPFRFVRRDKNIPIPRTRPSTELSALFKEVLATA